MWTSSKAGMISGKKNPVEMSWYIQKPPEGAPPEDISIIDSGSKPGNLF